MKAIKLSASQWAEIFYALETKSWAIRRGDFGPDDIPGARDEKWLEDIQEIQDKITASHVLR